MDKYQCYFCGHWQEDELIRVELLTGTVNACPNCASSHGIPVANEKFIVWSFKRTDGTQVFFHDIDDLLLELQEEIEANSIFAITLTLTVEVHEMTQAEIDAIPELDE